MSEPLTARTGSTRLSIGAVGLIGSIWRWASSLLDLVDDVLPFVDQVGMIPDRLDYFFYGDHDAARLGSISRVPAAEIEQVIVSALQEHIADQHFAGANRIDPLRYDHQVLASLVSGIEVEKNKLVISLKLTERSTEAITLQVSWQKPPSKRSREILLPHGVVREQTRPERAERRARLVSAIARSRRWLDELVTGAVKDGEQLAKRERCSMRQVNLTLSLAFLASTLVKAAVEGRLPRGINIERLRDPNPDWTQQLRKLGLDPVF